MSRITSFITELIRAANSEEQQTDAASKRLLDESIGIIYHLRGLLRYRLAATTERLHHLQSMSKAVEIGWASNAQIRFALLEAASMIRELHIEASQRTLALEQADAPPA